MSAFTPRSREDVVQHLVHEHAWTDIATDIEIWGGPAPRWKIKTADGAYLQTTEELLSIHREIAALEASS